MVVGTNDQKDDQFEKVIADYFERVDDGETVSSEAVIAKHPALADRLVAFFRDLQTINAAIGLAADVDDQVDEPCPESIARYKVIRRIGHGGFGQVFEAHDAQLDRSVAIKVPHPHRTRTKQQRERFVAEGRSLARVRHPGLLAVYDAGQTDDVCFTVTEYVAGESLGDLLRRGRVPREDAIRIALQIAEGLQAAHEAGIVHRDLKPANIFLGESGRVCIGDFGLALDLRRDIQSERPAGTPSYMAPEAFLGADRTSSQSDLWSLGIIMHELFFGCRPDTNVDGTLTIGSAVSDASTDKRGKSDLAPIVKRCLQKPLHLRYQSCNELANDLRHVSGAEKRAHRRRKLVAALAVVMLMVAIGTWVSVKRLVGLQTTQALVGDFDSGSKIVTDFPILRGMFTAELNRRLDPTDAKSNLKPLALLAVLEPERLPDIAPSIRTASINEIESTRNLLDKLAEHSDLLNDFREQLRGLTRRAERKSEALRYAAVLGWWSVDASGLLASKDSAIAKMANAYLNEPQGESTRWAQMLRHNKVLIADLRNEVVTAGNDSPPPPKAIIGWIVGSAGDYDAIAEAFGVLSSKDLKELIQPMVSEGLFTVDELKLLSTKCAQRPRAYDPDHNDEWAAARIAEANAALVLAVNGSPETLWQGLAYTTRPCLRTHLIDRAVGANVPLHHFVGQLKRADVTKDVAAGCLLILANAAIAGQEIANDDVDVIAKVFHGAGDSGIHYAAKRALDVIGRRVSVKAEPPHQAMAAGRNWYRSPNGIDFAILPPGKTLIGSLKSEDNRLGYEHRKEVFIPRTLAIATTEVSQRQFAAIMQDGSESSDLPKESVVARTAMRFCLELSRQEGIPPEEWCYREVVDNETNTTDIIPVDDILKRTGYRLLTLAEWEYGCRAGTHSAHWAGEAGNLLRSRCWSKNNSKHNNVFTAHDVGTRHPNPFGLFDMLGNAPEWCQTAFKTGNVDAKSEYFPGDVDDQCQWPEPAHMVQRESTYYSYEDYARSARFVLKLNRASIASGTGSGFRVGRTLKTH